MEIQTIKGFLHVSQPFGNQLEKSRCTLKNFLPNQNAIGIINWTSWGSCLRWPPKSIKRVDMKQLQQCKDGLIINLFHLYLLRHKIPAKSTLYSSQQTKSTNGCGSDYLGESPHTQLSQKLHQTTTSSPRRLHIGPDKNRYLLWTRLCIPSRRGKFSKLYKGLQLKILYQFRPPSYIS